MTTEADSGRVICALLASGECREPCDPDYCADRLQDADYGVMCEVCSDSRGKLTEEEAFAYAVRHLDQPFVVKVPHRPYVVKRLTARVGP